MRLTLPFWSQDLPLGCKAPPVPAAFPGAQSLLQPSCAHTCTLIPSKAGCAVSTRVMNNLSFNNSHEESIREDYENKWKTPTDVQPKKTCARGSDSFHENICISIKTENELPAMVTGSCVPSNTMTCLFSLLRVCTFTCNKHAITSNHPQDESLGFLPTPRSSPSHPPMQHGQGEG